MVKNSDTGDVSATNGLHPSAWFAKCLLSLKIPNYEKKQRTNIGEYKIARTACERNDPCYEDMRFVQWYKTLNENEIEVQKIGAVQTWVRLWGNEPLKSVVSCQQIESMVWFLLIAFEV